jgi:hypothetical protein
LALPLALALAFLAACSELPEIPANVCGNGVLEPGEDCDGFAVDELACRAPGMVGQCHLDCAPGEDNTPTACPAGWGCDPDDVCRKATGHYQAMGDGILGNAWSLASADFDGDGRADVLATEQPTSFGLTKMRVHRFDREGTFAGTFTGNSLIATPHPLRLPDDVRSDLAFAAGGGVGVFRGEANGTLISEALPSYFVPNAETRLINVLVDRIRGSTALLVVTRFNGGVGLYRQSLTTERIELVAPLPGGVEQLAAEPLAADLREDPLRYPCLDVVLAFRDASELTIYAACRRDPEAGEVDWRAEIGTTVLPLEPTARITHGLLSADLDGDTHLDLLVGTENGPYVAYGDGANFSALQPYALGSAASAEMQGDARMPVAAGDLTGDGIAELVMPFGVLFADASDGTRPVSYSQQVGMIGVPWTEALIADFNRDGHPDLMAGSSLGLDLDFYAGTSSKSMNAFTIPTDRPVEHLAYGDLDGDQVNDLAFVQRGKVGGNGAEVSVAFGDLQGAPEPPRAVARLERVQQIAVFTSGSETTFSNLGLVYDQEGDDGELGSAIALLGGNPDRSMPCIVELSTFRENGALNTAFGLAIVPGTFTAKDRGDVIALTVADAVASGEYELWVLPDLGSRRGIATRLGWGFERDLQPLIARDDTYDLAVTMAAGDLDGDEIDELVLAGADGTGTRCLIATANVIPDGEAPLQVHPTIVLEAACDEQAQLSVVDLDGDGQRDVLALIGVDGEKRLFALWGDGSRQLDAGRLDDLAPAGGEPLAFAPFRAAAGEPLSVAYVTLDGVRVLREGKRERSFEDDGLLAPLERGSGIVAADVDGDGVTDLAVADSGVVRVLRAELEAP